ncbi:MAG: SagB/ThcOx family dehydrogenase [Dehalococcoidia bacterium]|nr:SagB/ThcOx family dehydrogenase [Dehalococcoidia bacterium]
MSRNRDTGPAWSYHDSTKLSYIDLTSKPPLYKPSEGRPLVALPRGLPPPEMPAIQAAALPGGGSGGRVDVAAVAQLLHYSSGLVRKAVVPSVGEVHYRAAASAGALYPIEAYVVCGDVDGLPMGVYRFSPPEAGLYQVREGDFRRCLSLAEGDGDGPAWDAAVVLTAVFWRSAWKYRARSYRYCFWDAGTVLANLLATATALGLPGRVSAGFVDEEVDRLLGLEGGREAALCVVPLGDGTGSRRAPDCRLPTDARKAPAARGETVYPEMRELHRESCLGSVAEVQDWKGVLEPRPAEAAERSHPLEPAGPDLPSTDGLGRVIEDRGSTRRFAREPISVAQLDGALRASTGRLTADFLGPGADSLLDVYVIVNAVEGLEPGAYHLTPGGQELELLRRGAFRSEAGHLCFEQALGADAAAVVFLMADLQRVLGRLGNRGYRAAQLEAGVVGGRLYLATHALGLGATGITFYDDEVTEFFSPHARGKSAMFVVPLGRKAAENRVRPFRSAIGVKLDALARGAYPAGSNP